MMVKAYSEEKAILLAQQDYGYPTDHIKAIPIKEPINMLWGLIRKKGEYSIRIVTPSKKRSNKKEKQSFKNGHVEIKEGVLKVTDPIDDGRYSSIVVNDPNIDVYINGKKGHEVLIITEEDVVEFRPQNINPITGLSVELSEDKMQAILKVYKQEGKRFYVKDVKKNIKIEICSGYEKIEPQDVTFAECVKALTDAGVNLEFIDSEAINKLLNLFNGGDVIAARGIAPIHGVKAQIKYYFQHPSKHIDDSKENLESDIYDEPIVEIGDILAIKTMPAIQGKDGLTVTGDIIKAKEIPDESLNAGHGVVILDNGTKAVALTSGRPVVKRGVINIIPVLVIPNDVNKDTGNIDFDGDVIIKGNIMDNMKIVAKGTIKVLGSVYNSEVISNESINILGKVIGGKIRAGISIVDCFFITPQLEIVEKVIRKLLEHIRINQKINTKTLQGIVQSEKSVVQKSMKEIENVLSLVENDKVDTISDLIEEINDLLLSTALYIRSISQVVKVYKDLTEYINSVKDLYTKNGNVSLQYAQNSTVQACGHIVIIGEGSYQSNLFAKNTITYKRPSSSVKGGILVAGKGIKAGIIGSNTGINTYCRVLDANGKVSARVYNSGTIININNNIKII